jgi:hypothetical protein
MSRRNTPVRFFQRTPVTGTPRRAYPNRQRCCAPLGALACLPRFRALFLVEALGALPGEQTRGVCYPQSQSPIDTSDEASGVESLYVDDDYLAA